MGRWIPYGRIELELLFLSFSSTVGFHPSFLFEIPLTRAIESVNNR